MSSESSDSSSTADATSARWCTTFATSVSRSARPNVQAPQEQSLDQRDLDIRVAEEKFTAALDLSAEARTVTVSPGTQETPMVLKAALLAATTIASTGERSANAQRHASAAFAGDQSTDRHLNTNIDVRVTSQPCFPGREAGANEFESRAQVTSRECIDGEPFGLPRMRNGAEKHGKTHCGPSSRQAPERLLLKDVGGTGLGGTLAVHVRSRYLAHARFHSRIQRHKEVRPVR